MSVPANSLSTSSTESKLQIPRAEVLRLAAVDDFFYCRHFFPKTFRQGSPDFHRDFWNAFNDQTRDYFAAKMFRGSAKTTLTRAAVSKRVAYGITNFTLMIAISEKKAIQNLLWLRAAVEKNVAWTSTFGLQAGKKWTDNWIEIINVPLQMTINIVAVGMTAGLRGQNLEDYRPDTILCDDICDEENVGTPEQLEKTSDLYYGAVAQSLAPKSEAPLRKLMLLQTPIKKGDLIESTQNDPAYATVTHTKLIETREGPQSIWPERFPTEEVLQEKDDYTRRNKLHIWLRENMCKIVSRETAPLQEDWLREYVVLPTQLDYYIGLDPASRKKKKNIHKSAGVVIGVNKQTANTYLINYFAQKGKNPDELWDWVVSMYRIYRPKKIGVETIAFQDMLAWYFQKKMVETQTFFPITEVQDRRGKADRIEQAFSGIGSQGRFFISPNHTEFKQGWTEWDGESDWDLGDAGAQAVALANPWMIIGNGESSEDALPDESAYPELVFEGGAP